MKLTKKLKKAIAIILATIMLLAAMPITTASAAEDIVYPGGEIRVTYSFAKDIWSTPCYFFEGKYNPDVLEFKNDENHWSISPMVVPHNGYVSAVASSAYGVEVKAGDKLVSLEYAVTNETKVNNLDFGFKTFELYDDNFVPLDESYVTYSVEILSRGEEQTTEPSSAILGDANGDNLITIADATLIQKAAASLDTVADKYIKAADVDGNGEINIKDATLIQKYIAGIQIEYNVGSAI